MPLDITKPLDNELARALPGYLRETRAAIESALGVVDQVNALADDVDDLAALIAAALVKFPEQGVLDTNSPTPSVDGGILFRTANTAETGITYLEDGYPGQMVIIIADDDNTTVVHSPGYILLEGGTSITFNRNQGIILVFHENSAANKQWVQVGSIGGGSPTGNARFNRDAFTVGVGGQQAFDTSTTYQTGQRLMYPYVNGELQPGSKFTETDSNTVTFSEVLPEGTFVELVYVTTLSVAADVDDLFIVNKPYIDERQYSSFAEAITYAVNQSKVLLISRPVSISANMTIEANLLCITGGELQIASGYNIVFDGSVTLEAGSKISTTAGDLTFNNSVILNGGVIENIDGGNSTEINGPFTCGLFQCFDGAGNVTFGSGSVAEVYPEWWGAKGDGVTNNIPAFAKVVAACKDGGLTIKLSTGTYLITGNFPLSNPPPVTSVVDYNGLTFLGTGKNSVIKSALVTGADVFALSGVANINFKNIGIAADLLGGSAGAGSNGISITYGSHSIRVIDCYFYDLPYIDKGTYLDGGKAVTIQQSDTNPIYAIAMINCECEGGAYGFDYTGSGTAAISNGPFRALCQGNIFKNFYRGIVLTTSHGASAETAVEGQGISVIGNQCINCQQGIFSGGSTNLSVIGNQIFTFADLVGGSWLASDTKIYGILSRSNFRSSFIGNTVELYSCLSIAYFGGGYSGKLNTPSENCTIIGNVFSAQIVTSGIGIGSSSAPNYGAMLNSTFFGNTVFGAATAVDTALNYLSAGGSIFVGGDFASSTGWVLPYPTWTITDGKAVATSALAGQSLFVYIHTLEAGKSYICSVDVTVTAGSGGFYVFNETTTESLAMSTQWSSSGPYTRVVTIPSIGKWRFGLVSGGGPYTADHDNLQIRPLW